MKKYVGKKEVKAELCTLGEFIAKTGRNPYQNDEKMHGNDEPGYLVEYEDGYRSWSPAEVFENAYMLSETPLDRVRIEYNEVQSRLHKLEKFMYSGKMDEIIREKRDKFLLHLQSKIMKSYSNTLVRRMIYMEGDTGVPLKDMTFCEALEALKQGLVIRRSGWNGKGLCVFRQVPAVIHSDVIPNMQSLPEDAKDVILASNGFIQYNFQCLIYDTKTGTANSWVPSISDIFAEDWEVMNKDMFGIPCMGDEDGCGCDEDSAEPCECYPDSPSTSL